MRAVRYYMNVCDGHAMVEDPEGAEYPDDEHARTAALGAAQGLLAEGDSEGVCRRHWRFEILGQDGGALFEVPFSHALTPATLKLGPTRC
jgi:hypothetical protein